MPAPGWCGSFLLALGNWFGAETGYVSGWGAYWLGMNYPIRFVLFGGALLALCYGAQSLLRQRQLFTVSKAMGLTYLFIALWIMSIFGNYDADNWYRERATPAVGCCLPYRPASAFYQPENR